MARARTKPAEAPVAEAPAEPEVEEVEGEVVDEEPAEVREQIQTQELAILGEREAAVQPQTYLPTPKEYEAMTAISLQLAHTKFVPESYRGKPEEVLAAILTGRELGIGPMQSLRDIHMIDGRPAFAAHLLLAKLRDGGVIIVSSELTTERAWIHARRSDTGEEGEFEFTMAEAEAAKLAQKKNWLTYRKDMLWARAVSRMARRLGSDLMGGLVYSKEEVEDFDGGYDNPYGGEGYASTTHRPFDPGVDLLAGAVRGRTQKEVVERLNGLQSTLASDLDWPAMLEEAATARVGPKAERTPEQRTEVLKRWSNAVARMYELAEESDIYQPELGLQSGEQGDGIVIEGIRFGFEHELSAPLPRIEAEAKDLADRDAAGAPAPNGEQDDASAQELSEADAAIPFGDEGEQQ